MESEDAHTENKFSRFIGGRENQIFIGILVFAFVLRLYYFFTTLNQPVWWDEAEYLNIAKHFAGKYMADWWSGRPILAPLIFAGLYKVGLGEISFRFVEVLFSVFGVALTYFIVKDLYDKKVALLAALFMSVFWMHLFYTTRILVDVPSTTMWTLILFLFWRSIKTQKTKYYVLTGFALSFGILLRFPVFLSMVPIAIILLLNERLKVFTNKNNWIMLSSALSLLIPYFIWSYLKFGNPIYQVTYGAGAAGQVLGLPGFIPYIKLFLTYLQWPLLVLFIVGFAMFGNLFIGADMLIKNKEPKLKADLLILLWILIPLIYFSMQMRQEERYIFFIFPAVFCVASKGLFYIKDFIAKKSRAIAWIILVTFVIVGMFMQVSYAQQAIQSKINSYDAVRDAAIWMKENSVSSDTILTASTVQTQYYAERKVYSFTGTPEELRPYADEVNAKYAAVSVYEKYPDWVYTYNFETNGMKVAKAYFADPQRTQVVLIVYEF